MNGDEMKKIINSPDYYNRYDKDKHWDFVSVLAGRGTQSAEFNEIQNIFEEKLKSLGNALYAEGTIISGCAISFDPATKKASLEAGRVFLDGNVYEVDEVSDLDIPDIDTIHVGIWKKSSVLTEFQDQSLVDPAKNTPQYLMPGAYRIVTKAEWGLSTDSVDENTPFFPVYGISGGEIVTQLQKVNPEYITAVARYDNHANGSYVVEGLTVTPLEDSEAGMQTYSISEGIAHINGYEATIGHSVRLVTEEAPDLAEVQSEVHRFESDGTGEMTFTVSHTPIENVEQVRVTKERTVTLTHGNYAGCPDTLPDTSIFEIVKISQGALFFTEGTDFVLRDDIIDWSPSGEEPQPGATYTAIYHYRTNIAPDSFDTKTVTVSDLVENSFIEINYSYRMPRKDIIVMYKDCSVGIVRGISHRYDPVLPSTPPEAIRLAEVTQTWDGLPQVKNVAIKCVHVDTLNEMQSQILNLYSLVAKNELRFDATLNAPTSALNVFVDPLFDDDMRDSGIEQTALIADNTLQLPMSTDIKDLALTVDTTLDYTMETLIEQPARTQNMKVNPYQTFNPMPVQMSLNPAIDRWTTEIVKSITSRTEEYRSMNSRSNPHNYTVIRTVTITKTTPSTLRQIPVDINASGFGPNETVRVIFDGKTVTCSATRANASGDFNGTFTIPAGIPTGTKLVRLQGQFSTAAAYFRGIHQERSIYKEYIRFIDIDPLAQTFTLSESRLVSGVDFWLAAKSRTANLKIDIREVSLGYPTQETVASCTLKPSDLSANAWNRAVFETPVFLSADTEYAITIMTDSADYSVGIARLGEWDTSRGWIRTQAYSAGVLLSSSNASTWTADQNGDLTFRLLGAKFSSNKKTISLGTVNLTGVTDVMPMAEVERTGTDTDITFVIKKGSAEIARMQACQAISFDEPLSGDYDVSVELFGDEKYSPVLGHNPQLLTAKVAETGDYISRAFTCGANKRVMITLEEYVPTDASVEVYIQTGANEWTKAENPEIEEIGNGWVSCKYFVACDFISTRLKLVLAGTPAARPLVQNVSAVILSA